MIGHPGWHVLKGAQKIFTEKNLEAMILPATTSKTAHKSSQRIGCESRNGSEGVVEKGRNKTEK